MAKGKRKIRHSFHSSSWASKRRRGSSEELEFFAPTGKFAQRLLDSRRSPSSEPESPDPLAQVRCVWSPVAVFDTHQPTLPTTSLPQAVVGTSHLPFTLPPWERLSLAEKAVYEGRCQQLVTAAEESMKKPSREWRYMSPHCVLRCFAIHRTANEQDASELLDAHESLETLIRLFQDVLVDWKDLSVLLPCYHKLVHHGKSFLNSHKSVNIDSTRTVEAWSKRPYIPQAVPIRTSTLSSSMYNDLICFTPAATVVHEPAMVAPCELHILLFSAFAPVLTERGRHT